MSFGEMLGVIMVAGVVLVALYGVIYFAVRDAIRETRADRSVRPSDEP